MSLILTDQSLIDNFRMYFSRRGGVGVEGGRRPLEQAGWRLETSKRMWKAFVEFRSFHLLL